MPLLKCHRRTGLRHLAAAFLWALCPLAPVVTAQTAINSGAPLPLRNVFVEMRQAQFAHTASDSADTQSSVTSQQQVLVLNGRSGQIALRTTVPMRLMAVAFRNGRPTLVPGVVLLDATTGFRVTPRWDGTDGVELELAASQAANPRNPGQVASTASTVIVPLGAWTTVAESDQTQSTQRSSGLGSDASGSEQRYAVQVRLSVR